MTITPFKKQLFFLLLTLHVSGCAFLFPPSESDKVEELLPLLVSADRSKAQNAKAEITALLPAGAPAIIACAEHADAPLRVNCFGLLPQSGDLAEQDVLRALKSGFASADFPVQRAALFAAAGLPNLSSEIVPEVATLLDSATPEVTSSALVALGFMGERAAGALPAVKRHLQSDNTMVRIQAIATMARIASPEVKRSLGTNVSYVVTALKSDDPSVRAAAINALGQLGWQARNSVSAILAYVRDTENDAERVQAALALWRIGTKPSRKAAEKIIAKAKQSTDPIVLSAISAFESVRTAPDK